MVEVLLNLEYWRKNRLLWDRGNLYQSGLHRNSSDVQILLHLVGLTHLMLDQGSQGCNLLSSLFEGKLVDLNGVHYVDLLANLYNY